MPKRIPRILIEKFIIKKKLDNVAGFLSYVATREHLKVFNEYAQLKLPIHKDSRVVLFHGSQRYHQRFIASPEEKYIYATDDPNYAIFLGIIDLKNASAGAQVQKKAIFRVDLDFVNGRSSLRTGWVHVIENKDFKKIPNHEYISQEEVEVLFAIPVIPSDLVAPIQIIP